MVRVVTQTLLGLMFLFGVLTLIPRFVMQLRGKNYLKALYLLIICLVALFFTVMSFSYAYTGIKEWWK